MKDLLEKYKPYIEGAKEVARWLVLFVASWIITNTISQLGKIPESAEVKLWVFAYVIPVRLLFNIVLTFIGRYIDKVLHEIGKAREDEGTAKNPVTSKLVGGITRF
jgi:hypothetical protein